MNDKTDNYEIELDIINEQFLKYLNLFIETRGLDEIEACKKAQELLVIINE